VTGLALRLNPADDAGVMRLRLTALLVVSLCIAVAGCHSGDQQESTSSDPTVSAIHAALPSSATVSEAKGDPTWGNVIVVTDGDANMAEGPVPGATITALQLWLSDPSHEQTLVAAGWDHVLACHSAVNIDPSGGRSTASEMIPTRPGGVMKTVRTGEQESSAGGTSIDCP